MSLKELKLSEVQELANQVEYLVYHLQQIYDSAPNSERLILRLEKANERIEHSIKYSISTIERVLYELDYSKIEKGLENAVRNQVSVIIRSLDHIKQHSRALEDAHQKTNLSLEATSKLLTRAEDQIQTLSKNVNSIPVLNQKLMLVSAAGGFIAGAVSLYLISLLVWLPKPYFATQQQSILLQMVQDNTLKLESNTLDAIRVHVDFDHTKNIPTNINTGETK